MWRSTGQPEGTASPTKTSAMRSNIRLAREELDEHRALWLGPDRAGNLLEIVVLHLDQSDMVIHAMKMRAAYRRLLLDAEGEER